MYDVLTSNKDLEEETLSLHPIRYVPPLKEKLNVGDFVDYNQGNVKWVHARIQEIVSSHDIKKK